MNNLHNSKDLIMEIKMADIGDGFKAIALGDGYK